MNILELDGKQIGRNFIESGHIGVIIILSMDFSIKGPFKLKFLQNEPIGVEIRSPSPLNCPILTFFLQGLSKNIFKTMIDWSILL